MRVLLWNCVYTGQKIYTHLCHSLGLTVNDSRADQSLINDNNGFGRHDTRFYLQSSHCAMNCRQHTFSHGNGMMGEWIISRVSDQSGVSRLYIIVEIYHSGQKPSICSGSICPFGTMGVTKLLI